jgi:predicted anti-sigma-YlaC factor YlaD
VNGNKTDSQFGADRNKKMIECEDIQPLILDYMNRELGEGRAVAVREHLRKCKVCQAVAIDIQATLELLHTASKTKPERDRLSTGRRKRIIRAFKHPVFSWMENNLMILSLIGAIIVIIMIVASMRYMIDRRFAPMEGEPVTVIVVNRGQTNVVVGTTNVLSDDR